MIKIFNGKKFAVFILIKTKNKSMGEAIMLETNCDTIFSFIEDIHGFRIGEIIHNPKELNYLISFKSEYNNRKKK